MIRCIENKGVSNFASISFHGEDFSSRALIVSLSLSIVSITSYLFFCQCLLCTSASRR